MNIVIKDLEDLARVGSNPDPALLVEGVRNLLINCAGMQPGESLLVVAEDPALGWYGGEVAPAVANIATQLGLRAETATVGAPTFDGRLPETVARSMANHDQTVFFSRMGDQTRFEAQLPKRAPVMSYATNAAMLASPYGGTSYQAFLDLKAALNGVYDDAGTIRVTCQLGTDISGELPTDPDGPEDVSIKRFPMGIYKPLSCERFRGRVALSRFLVSTGSRAYSPSSVTFDDVVFAHIEGTRIAGFDGPAEAVRRVKAHYETVAGLFGIEQMYVHSWHSGMHPACFSPHGPLDNPDRWANTIFQNPRVLHFHTCGAFPPGEISWTVIDPTIEVDGRVLWQAGELNADAYPAIRSVLDRHDSLSKLFGERPA